MSDTSKDHYKTLTRRFEALGAEFARPAAEIAHRFAECRVLVFDWEGVFNDGMKGRDNGSGFSEPDSMGTNLLRYGLYCLHGRLPYSALISSAENPNARMLAEREHFDLCITDLKQKHTALPGLLERAGAEASEVAFVFDDVNDLGLAERVGLRFLIRRHASPMLAEFVQRRGFADYVTGSTAGTYAVREICELLLGLEGRFDEVVDSRRLFDAPYSKYWDTRQAVSTEFE